MHGETVEKSKGTFSRKWELNTSLNVLKFEVDWHCVLITNLWNIISKRQENGENGRIRSFNAYLVFTQIENFEMHRTSSKLQDTWKNYVFFFSELSREETRLYRPGRYKTRHSYLGIPDNVATKLRAGQPRKRSSVPSRS
jgi:hypothetical protein